MSPFFTVVIPTFNCADYLERALNSVFSQACQNFEIIVVDNSSTDHTNHVLKSYNDKRLTVIEVNNNGIIALSRNKGIENAKGDWIAFLDADDLWYQEKLQIVFNEIQSSKFIDVFSTDEFQIDEDTGTKTHLRYGPYCKDFYKILLLNGNRLSTSATIVNRNFLKKNRINFREHKEFATVEDYDFWLLMARAGAEFQFIESIQGEYTIHSDNTSTQSGVHYQNGINVLKDHVYNLQAFEQNKDNLWQLINSRLLISSAKNMFINKHYISSLKFILKAFCESFTGTFSYIATKINQKKTT